MPLTLYGANFFLDAVLGSETPATVYVALMNLTPTYLSTGSTIEEPTGNSYARAEVANDSDHWGPAADGFKANIEPIIFPTATGLWGNMRYFAILDASSGGNILVWGGISSRLVTEGVTVRLARDQLSVTAR